MVTSIVRRSGEKSIKILVGRLDCFTDGTLDQCLALGMTPLAWSPLAGGWLGEGGTVAPGSPRHHLLALMDSMAASYEVTRTEIALAFLLKHPSGIVPIVGSTRPEKIRQAVRATEIELSREDWYRLLVAARQAPLP